MVAPTRGLLFGLLSLLLLSTVGCNPPRETLPVLPSSAGTTLNDSSFSSGTTFDSEEDMPLGSGVTLSDGLNNSSAAEDREEPEVSIASYEQVMEAVKQADRKLVVLDIWSNSCIPCLQEFPNLVELSHKYPDELTCMSLNVDYIGIKSKPPESYLPKIEEFLKKSKATLTNFASSDPDSDIFTSFEIESIPAVIIFDDQGEIIQKFTDANSDNDGFSYEGDVIPKLEELLGSDE